MRFIPQIACLLILLAPCVWAETLGRSLKAEEAEPGEQPGEQEVPAHELDSPSHFHESAFGLSRLYLGIDFFWGYSGTSVGATQKAPTLLQFGLGTALGYEVAQGVNLCLGTDIRTVNQYSEVTEGVGNRRGYRWNSLFPLLAFRLGQAFLKADAQFFGSYQLRNLTADGQELKYESPLGARVGVYAPIFEDLFGGFYFEYLTFSKQSLSASGEATLDPKLTLWQAGFGLSWLP